MNRVLMPCPCVQNLKAHQVDEERLSLALNWNNGKLTVGLPTITTSLKQSPLPACTSHIQALARVARDDLVEPSCNGDNLPLSVLLTTIACSLNYGVFTTSIPDIKAQL